jgi:HK97 family phage major capsid protein
MTTQEIEERKAELLSKIDEAKTSEEVEELRKQVEEVRALIPDDDEKEEVKEEKKEEEANATEEAEATEEVKAEEVEAPAVDERNLIRVGAEEIIPIGNVKEERKMEKYDIEARAFAKKILGKDLNEDEKRALGDAVGTTATTFVEATADAQGINNLGLYIPKSIRMALEERARLESPIYRDVRKLQVNGNVDVPYLYAGDDASWYVELSATANEGQEHKAITLVGRELAKNIEITWKLDQMTPEGLLDWIVDELYDKMYKAKVNAIIYGTGATHNQPSGLTLGLTPVTTGATPIDLIANTKATLDVKAKVGAKVYIASAVADAIRYYKNQEGNYPFLMTLPTGVEEDPYLHNNDVVVGNMKNYVWNEQEEIRIDRDIDIKKRTIIYSAYQVCDGGAKAGAFAYGQFGETPSV